MNTNNMNVIGSKCCDDSIDAFSKIATYSMLALEDVFLIYGWFFLVILTHDFNIGERFQSCPET